MAPVALQASLTIRRMPPESPPNAPPNAPPPNVAPAADPARRPGSRLRLAAALILGVGLLAAAAVWTRADDRDTPAVGVRIVGGQAFPITDSAATDRQTERLGGRALVRVAALDRWLGSLWHGRRLAVLIAVLAMASAAVCVWIAGPASDPPDA